MQNAKDGVQNGAANQADDIQSKAAHLMQSRHVKRPHVKHSQCKLSQRKLKQLQAVSPGKDVSAQMWKKTKKQLVC